MVPLAIEVRLSGNAIGASNVTSAAQTGATKAGTMNAARMKACASNFMAIFLYIHLYTTLIGGAF
jgi:hypothetical protein